MQLEDIERIGDYVMPERPAVRSDLALIFGTRHGVEDFCQAVVTLWHNGMFRKAVVSGGMTAGLHDSEAETMATRLMELGIPEHVLIIEPLAMNTGENVWRSRELAERMLPLEERRSVIAIGKICSARRYLMTMARHWPGPIVTAQWVNYFAVDKSDWHLDPEFAERVRADYVKIPHYIRRGFLIELPES